VTPTSVNQSTFERRLDGCPACGAPGAQLVANTSGIRLVRCASCTLVYSNPQPVEAVRTRYLEEYDLAAHFDRSGERKRVLFGRRLERIGLPSKSRERLCDVGCAGGQFLKAAQEVGWQTSGIELNPPAAAKARTTGAEVYEGALESLDDLPWRSFDVVTCWDVLEHTPAPRAFVRNLSRLVASGGFLAVTTLNWSSLVRRIVGMRWTMIADEHFTYWTEEALRRVFELEDLVPTSSESFGLGRDLVRPFERLASRVGQLRHGRGVAKEADHGSWDTSPAVLLAERAANAGLRLTGTGVGLAMTFVARP
jgi:2-polyprenyl-3-methyl-5-hydroxy-6-metoxy-1,4-benzoquinol methylase